MIASLRGRPVELQPDAAVIEVNGVGYRVFMTPKALAGLVTGVETLVQTVTYVREDTLALYGFVSSEERGAFEQLLATSGVGPKLALAVLAVHTPSALRRIVAEGDAHALTIVPGVGPKGAARLVLELRGKLGEPGLVLPADGAARPTYGDVREALAGLGYSPAEIKAALEDLPAGAGELPAEEVLRLTLRTLSGRRPAGLAAERRSAAGVGA